MTSRATAGGNSRKKEEARLKESEELDWLEETEEEAREYDQRIKDEIRWKLDPVKPRDEQPIPATSSPDSEGKKSVSDPMAGPSSEPTLQNSSEPLGDINRVEGGIGLEDGGEGSQAGQADQTMMDFSMPSFRPSNIAHSTPKPISTSTFPHIPTPTFTSTPKLPSPNKVTPGPSKTSRHPPTTLVNETPMHIDSPIDTPTGEGRGRRDDPATPVPLGVEKFNLLKGKKDFQTLTKHFEMFTKQSERQKKLAAEPITRKGKMAVQGKGSEMLGGKVFEGLRICFPPELGNTSKQKTHWDIVRQFFYGSQRLMVDIETRRSSHSATGHGGHTCNLRFRSFSPDPSSATWSPNSVGITRRNSLCTIRLGGPLSTSCTSSRGG